jgi:uncharacterized protein YciI
MSLEDEISSLTGRMIRKKFYVVLSRGGGRDLKAILPEHLRYMIDLEKQGKLFASGPFNQAKSGDGMTILRVDSEDEARSIAQRDPFVLNGIRTFEIREWTLMEGSFGITVNFSDQSTTIA